jgi:hypothetical protein
MYDNIIVYAIASCIAIIHVIYNCISSVLVLSHISVGTTEIDTWFIYMYIYYTRMLMLINFT